MQGKQIIGEAAMTEEGLKEDCSRGSARHRRGAEKRRGRIFSFGLVLTLLCISGLLISGGEKVFADPSGERGPSGSVINPDRLAGRWIRPDGGYILDIKGIEKDGKVKAAYFNPRAVNVFKARVQYKEGVPSLFVELRDINYPGSKYNLRYDSFTDRLKGKYFQAVEKRTFDVEFVRDDESRQRQGGR